MTTIVGSVLEKAGTMEHLLDRIPNVSAQNGNIKVFGRGEPIIYINGRQMRDRSELDRLSSDNIKSVEVISNPGARYAASTKAVIRINTKKEQKMDSDLKRGHLGKMMKTQELVDMSN